MLKFENCAEVGQKIKALDFQPMPGRRDSYLIGRVIEKGPMYGQIDDRVDVPKIYICDGYKVYVTDSVSGSDRYDMERLGTEMIVPFESSFDFDERVQLA